MERSTSNNGMGLLAVCAVSWSVAMIALQAHKRLISDFMKKIELHSSGSGSGSVSGRERYGSCKVKKVRFAKDVIEPSTDNKEYRRSRGRRIGNLARRRGHYEKGDEGISSERSSCEGDNGDTSSSMPLNRQVLYRGIIEHRMIKGPTNLPRHF